MYQSLYLGTIHMYYSRNYHVIKSAYAQIKDPFPSSDDRVLLPLGHSWSPKHFPVASCE